jgi:hypothetical protein
LRPPPTHYPISYRELTVPFDAQCPRLASQRINNLNIQHKIKTLFQSQVCIVDWVKNMALEAQVVIVPYIT